MTRASQLASHARTLQNRMWGQEATYTRQSTSTDVAVVARKSAVKTMGATSEEVVVSTEWFDWILTAAELVDDGTIFEPAERDKLTVEQEDGKTAIYMIGPYGTEKPWEPVDSDCCELVVHTKVWSES